MLDLLYKLQRYSNKVKESTLKTLAPKLLEELLSLTFECPKDTPWYQRRILLQAGHTKFPFCPVCKVNYRKITKSWLNDYCSSRCSNIGISQDSSRAAKAIAAREITMIERYGTKIAMDVDFIKTKQVNSCLVHYGVKNPSQAEEVKKLKQDTCLKNFGVKNPGESELVKAKMQHTNIVKYGKKYAMQSEKIIKILKESISRRTLEDKKKTSIQTKKTCLARYGVEVPLQSSKVLEKVKHTNLIRYGFESAMKNEEIRAKLKGPTFSKEINDKITSQDFWYKEYVEQSKSVRQIAEELGINASGAVRYFHDFSELELRPISISSGEMQLKEFIGKFVTYLPNHKLFANKHKSVDIYISELKIAFEYNGLYWHCDEFRVKEAHLEKTLECERLGIRLIHIWEDDWIYNRSLMERKIKSLLGKETQRIFARKTSILVPTQEQKRNFYSANHIKGDGGGSSSYALSYQNQIIAMITLKNMQKGIWDLNRYATSINVVGGFSKLLEHFKRNNNWEQIYTFADRSWSQGAVYLKCGFTLVEEQPPTFYGIEQYKRINRLQYTHEKLSKRFPNLKGTQREIMNQAGIKLIWDCGQLKFTYNRK